MEKTKEMEGYSMGRAIETVPYQRIIEVNKQPADKQHLYTTNNLSAIDEASFNLQSVGGFKLYIYLAKNQNKYTFALSRRAFMQWSGLKDKAYTTGFNELVDKGYLIQDDKQKNKYKFYDKSQKEEQQIDDVIIEYAETGFRF